MNLHFLDDARVMGRELVRSSALAALCEEAKIPLRGGRAFLRALGRLAPDAREDLFEAVRRAETPPKPRVLLPTSHTNAVRFESVRRRAENEAAHQLTVAWELVERARWHRQDAKRHARLGQWLSAFLEAEIFVGLLADIHAARAAWKRARRLGAR